MKILIFGSTGMLGHQLVKSLRRDHEVIGISRAECDVRNLAEPARQLMRHGPEVVINAVGIVKQRISNAEEMIAVNALFPQQLARLTRAAGMRLIHFSTDCVFSGSGGFYHESDPADPVDVYGHTKLLGEIIAPNCVTLRTSIIGRELGQKRGLLEWLLASRGWVHGHTNALFTGLTTQAVARAVEHVLARPAAHGLFHLGGYMISKRHLLEMLIKHYKLNIQVVPSPVPVISRCLNACEFIHTFQWTPPTWAQMIGELE